MPVPIEFIDEGRLYLAPDREFKIIGEDDKISLEVGNLQKEAEYHNFDELLEARKARFQTAEVKTVSITNIDFNRIAADRIEQLLDECEMTTIKLEIEREEYHRDVSALIQRLADRAKLEFTMRNFTLDREQLLTLKPVAIIKTVDTNTPVEDDLLLDLTGRGHRMIMLETRLESPETIKQVFKLIADKREDKFVAITINDTLFTQFFRLIGARIEDDELVMEEGSEFSVCDDDRFCVCPYNIVLGRALGMISRSGDFWRIVIARMSKLDEEEDSEAPRIREFTLAGKGDKLSLEVGRLEKEVEYDGFDELLEARRARFQRARVNTVVLRHVDFNRIAADRVEQLLEGCKMKTIKFYLNAENYNQDVFALIQRLENRSTIELLMRNFILDREQLLSLSPTGNLKTDGTITSPIDDELLLALTYRDHGDIALHTKLESSETIRDVFKYIAGNEEDQHVRITVSNDLFQQFVRLIGARFEGKELVMENDGAGFDIRNDHSMYCIGDYCIVFERAFGIIYRSFSDDNPEWTLMIMNMMKREEEEKSYDEEDDNDNEDEDEDEEEEEESGDDDYVVERFGEHSFIMRPRGN